jgi:hypothetical protein
MTFAYHRYEALKAFLNQFSKFKASPLARSATHYVTLPQAWGLPDPSIAAAAANNNTQPPLGGGEAQAERSTDNSSATGGGEPTASPSDESGLPPYATSRAMIAECCGLGAEAYGKHGPDVDLFLEQAVIAVRDAVLMGTLNHQVEPGLRLSPNRFAHLCSSHMEPLARCMGIRRMTPE